MAVFIANLKRKSKEQNLPQIFGKRRARDLKPAKADGGVLVTEGCINKGLRKRKTTLIHVPLRPLLPAPAEPPRKTHSFGKNGPEGT